MSMVVNYSYITAMIGLLPSYEAYSEAPPEFVVMQDSPNYEATARAAIRIISIPEFKSWSGDDRANAKRSLAHLLTFEPERADSLSGQYMTPFEFPSRSITFFEWLWEEFFPGDDWRLPGPPDDYVVVEDPDVPTRRVSSPESGV